MSTTSVSKGCFVFKGNKKKANAEDYFPESTSSKNTFKQYNKNLSDIISRIEELQENLCVKIFDELIGFVKNAHASYVPKGNDKYLGSRLEIPTAALVTGINMPDHGGMFKNLTDLIKKNVTNHIAILQSKECPNVKTMISKTISDLIGGSLEVDDDAERNVNVKSISCTMTSVASWYSNLAKIYTSKSPKNKRKSVSNSYPPVVLVFEDIEGFSATVLQDFITICSNHLSSVPFVMVFGIATTVTAVHKLLPHSVSSLLCLEKFQAPPATDYLTEIINEVVMTPDYPFKLGPKVFQLLLDIFLCQDFSVMNYVTGLKYALLDQFYNNPVSYLCCPLPDGEKIVKTLKKEQITEIIELPSFVKYLSEMPVEDQSEILENESELKEIIIFSLKNIHDYHKSFFPVLHCLHTLTSELPKHPLGRKVREMYCLSLESNVTDTKDYNDCMMILRHLSHEELVSQIDKCSKYLSNNRVPIFKADLQKLEDIHDKLTKIEDLTELANPGEDEDNESFTSVLPKKTKLSQLKEQLKEIEKQKKKKKMTVFEVLRMEAIDLFDELFRKHLFHYQTLPLHEVFYYDSVKNIRKQLVGAPRVAIHTALSNPYQYLQNEACVCDGGYISPKLPDICIVYKLHLECGRFINLYDWMQAFITVVTAAEEGPKKRKKTKQPDDKVLQARFIRAVSELQFLGFIKPTKRKTDHVARLTWGGC